MLKTNWPIARWRHVCSKAQSDPLMPRWHAWPEASSRRVTHSQYQCWLNPISGVFLNQINANKQRYQGPFLDFWLNLSGLNSNGGCWNILTACSLWEGKAQCLHSTAALCRVKGADERDKNGGAGCCLYRIVCSWRIAVPSKSRTGDGKERSKLLDSRLR